MKHLIPEDHIKTVRALERHTKDAHLRYVIANMKWDRAVKRGWVWLALRAERRKEVARENLNQACKNMWNYIYKHVPHVTPQKMYSIDVDQRCVYEITGFGLFHND